MRRLCKMLMLLSGARDQCSTFSTGGKFHPDYVWTSIGVTCSYSSRPFLCALACCVISTVQVGTLATVQWSWGRACGGSAPWIWLRRKTRRKRNWDLDSSRVWSFSTYPHTQALLLLLYMIGGNKPGYEASHSHSAVRFSWSLYLSVYFCVA